MYIMRSSYTTNAFELLHRNWKTHTRKAHRFRLHATSSQSGSRRQEQNKNQQTNKHTILSINRKFIFYASAKQYIKAVIIHLSNANRFSMCYAHFIFIYSRNETTKKYNCLRFSATMICGVHVGGNI